MSNETGGKTVGPDVRLNTVASYVTVFSVIYSSGAIAHSMFCGLMKIPDIATSVSTSSDPSRL